MNNYYEKNASKYIEDTINCDMSEQYTFFLKHMSRKGLILDIGFGSGRDMRYFKSIGYEVEGIDPTISFVNNLKDEFDVYHKRVEDITVINRYDGIWACASLLHIKREDLLDVFRRCFIALKQDGVMYASFKCGDFEGTINHRYFTYLTEGTLTNIIKQTNFKIEELWINEDKLYREVKWLNVLLSIF